MVDVALVTVFSQLGVKSASRELRLNAARTMIIKLEWFCTFSSDIGAEATHLLVCILRLIKLITPLQIRSLIQCLRFCQISHPPSVLFFLIFALVYGDEAGGG